MITKQDLLESIAECQGIRNPNANTCLKLAAFYTILDHMQDNSETSSGKSEKTEVSERSFSVKPFAFGTPEEVISYQSNSEFAKAINGMSASAVWGIVDELVSMVQILEPKLYSAVMRKIEEVK